MNRYIFKEDGGFLIVETKWGNVVVEQSEYETSVKFIPNLSFMNNPSHIEDVDSDESYVNILRMVSDNAPSDY